MAKGKWRTPEPAQAAVQVEMPKAAPVDVTVNDPRQALRERLARIIEHRIMQTPIPSELAFHDNLAFTNMRRVAEIKAIMVREGAKLEQAYEYALRSIQ